MLRQALTIVPAALFLILSGGAGCGLPNATAMGGTWLFRINSSSSGIIILTVNLQQHGSQITGQATVTASATPCGTAATVVGNLLGNTLNLDVAQYQTQLFLVGTVNSTFTNAQGTYTSSGSGACFLNGDFGSWSAVFES